MTIDVSHGGTIYWVLLISAMVVSALFCIFTIKKFGFSYADLIKIALIACAFGLVGARLFSFLFRLGEVFENSEMLIPLLTSGYMYYGGVIGGGIGGCLYCKAVKKDPVNFMDMGALILPLAHAIGRLGCLFNGCCYGAPTESLFFVCYPNGVWNGFETVLHSVHLLPVQLMESIFNCVLFIVLFLIFLKKYSKGLLAGIYLIAYATWRFAIEFARTDTRGSILFLSTSQFISLFIAIPIGIFMLVLCVKRKRAAKTKEIGENIDVSQQTNGKD